ncbi:MAG: transglycosylase domain-containing protein [Hyphomicrobiaceae bacterium]
MSDWMYKRGGGDRLINWMALDAWIDSSLHETWLDVKNKLSAASAFFDRFRISGVRKFIVEILSESINVGVAGASIVVMLALPAYQLIPPGDWLAPNKYSVTFIDQDGNEIGKRGILQSNAVPLEEIPKNLIDATLATEDRRFYSHFGIDVFGTFRALVENLRAKTVVQGGSSVTQQLAKNLFLSSERSLDRKIKEAFLAIWIEARLSKDDILKNYLDRAYMGGGAFGVEAASQFYFGKSVREINLAEAATLAGLFKAPTRYAPHVNLPASRARTEDVLDNIVEAGLLTESQVYGARLNPARIVEDRTTNSPDWFLDWAFDEVQRLMTGKNTYVVTARTTVDLRLQNAAQDTITSTVRQFGRSKRVGQGALVSMETNGAVRAIVGGKDYGDSQFNRATTAKRQPGSSFKPYVYLTALEHGFSPRSGVRDGPVACGRRHSIKNYSGGYRGRMTMATALAKSVNTVAVRLTNKVGRKSVLANLAKLGITGVRSSCTMALGDTGITALQHTSGYAPFANGGFEVRPYAITEIINTGGETVYLRERDEPKPRRLFDKNVVSQLNTMLQGVVTGGTGRRSQLEFTYSAGKTGTSSAYRDAWFMGYTGKYVTGVWFGNDSYRPTNRVTGGSLPAQAWQNYMTIAHDSMDIPQIAGLPLHPTQVEERKRLAALRAANPQQAEAAKRKGNNLPSRTRKILERLVRDLSAISNTKAGSSGPNDRANSRQAGANRTPG